MSRSSPPNERLVYAKLIATVFFWGSNFAVGKIAVQSLGPYSAAFLRFVVGTAFLLAAYVQQQGFRVPVLSKRQWGYVFWSGLTGVFLYNLCFFAGMQHIAAVRASLLVTLSTLSITLLSAWFFAEKLSPLKILGVVVALVGTAVVVVRGRFEVLLLGEAWGLGETLITGCVLAWTAYTLLGKVILREIPALTLSTFAALIGTLLLAIPAVQEGVWTQVSHASWASLLAVAYIGFTSTALGFVWYYDAVRAIGASKAAVVGNLTPVFAVLVAVGWLGEELALVTAFGGVLVLLGVWLTNK